MKFSESANRLTGISTPFGGASWQPAELEDIRGAPGDTEELGKIEGTSELSASLRAMRAACRKFLEGVGKDGREGIRYAIGSNVHSWTLGSALGELRGTFGVHITKIAAKFRLDAVLPAHADSDTIDDDHILRRLHL